jgi:hypothetical protein
LGLKQLPTDFARSGEGERKMAKQEAIRTQITDLPEIAVELSEREMRIVSGGLTPTARACVALVYPGGSALPSNTANDGDHDTDWPKGF